jgi:hypothetical protein
MACGGGGRGFQNNNNNNNNPNNGGARDMAYVPPADFAMNGGGNHVDMGGGTDLGGGDLSPGGGGGGADMVSPAPDLAGGDGGAIDLGTTVAPPNATCAAATALTAGTPVSGDTRGATVRLDGVCRSNARGPTVFYAMTLQPAQKLTVVVTPSAPMDAVVRILDGCAATSCLLDVDSSGTGAAETATYTNARTTAQPVIVAVSAYDDLNPGTFSMTVAVAQLPPNTSCASPTVVGDGTTLTNQDASLATETQTAACQSSATGKVLYYQATVPPGARLRVRAQAQTSWDPVIRVLAACGVTSCVADANAGSGVSEVLSWTNPKMTPQTVLFAVGSKSATTTGKFDLDVRIGAVPPPPSNTTCANAQLITAPATLSAQDPTTGSSTGCSSGGSGKNLYYAVDVPANATLKVELTTTSGYDSVIRLLPSPCSTSCITTVDASISTNPERLEWKNTGADRRVIVALGPWGTSSSGNLEFDAAITIVPPPAPPANATCAGATAVANGTSLPMETPELAATTLDGVCLANAKGKVLYYAVTLQDGETLKAKVTPATGWDPVLRLLDGCAATACVATGDGYAAGAPEELTYRNTTGAAQNLILAVGSYDAASTGKFGLTVQIN